MIDQEPFIKIDISTDGSFTVHDGTSGRPLEQIDDKQFVELLAKGVREGSFVNPLVTYLKINSGVIIIGGRRFVCPSCP
jgi:hypothetical protein